MLLWMSSSGAALSDSQVEDELFFCVMLFSDGEALFAVLPKGTVMVFHIHAWISRPVPMGDPLWVGAQVPLSCFIRWLFEHNGTRWIVFPIRCDSPGE